MLASLTKKDGDKKFSMNQNLTVLLVFFITLEIMIDANLCETGVNIDQTLGYILPRRDVQMLL
jgi:hypothetical protein